MYCFIKKTLSVLIFAGIIAGEVNIAFARWANYDDAESETEHTTRTIYINKDGTGSEIYEMQAKLLKENAKAGWAKYDFSYNSHERTVEILEGYTVTNGKKYPVNRRKIKKQPVPGDLRTIREQTQIIVPYPKLKIGSTVYLKAKFTDFIPSISNRYSAHFTFGEQFYARSASVYITSELPLHISINDPDKILNIKESTKIDKDKTLYCLEIQQEKPIYKDIIDEDTVHFNLKYVPVVSVAAMPTREYYGKTVAIEYTKIKNQALPALYQNIANIAMIKVNNIDKINTVISLLHKNITYLINPKYGYFPQPLQMTADVGHGDCKDFSIATCAILQAIGISAKIAFVRQGEITLPFPSSLPGDGINHAIVKAELPEGPLWLDPTSKGAMAHYICPNITNRKAVVFYEDYAADEYIPCTQPEDYRLIKRETWNMKNLSKIQIKGTIEFLEGAVGSFIGVKNTLSATEIKDMLLSSVMKNDNEILNYDIKLPNLIPDTMKNLSFDYTMTVKAPKTKDANLLPIFIKSARSFMTEKNAVSAVHLGAPRIFETYITLQNITASEEKSLDCDLESPWVNLSRKVNYEIDKHQILIHKKMEVKKSWIEDTELGSKAYKQLQEGIAQNLIG